MLNQELELLSLRARELKEQERRWRRVYYILVVGLALQFIAAVLRFYSH